jgi:hypothetical protein
MLPGIRFCRETMKTSLLLFSIFGAASTSAFALDPLSYAHYDQVKTRAVHLDLAADFTRKTLSGYAELTLDWLDPNARTLDLDTRGLAIARVQVQDAQGRWSPAPFKLDKLDEEKGQALHIALKTQPAKVRIDYRTPCRANVPSCSASRSRSTRARGCRCRIRRQCALPTRRALRRPTACAW